MHGFMQTRSTNLGTQHNVRVLGEEGHSVGGNAHTIEKKHGPLRRKVYVDMYRYTKHV